MGVFDDLVPEKSKGGAFDDLVPRGRPPVNAPVHEGGPTPLPARVKKLGPGGQPLTPEELDQEDRVTANLADPIRRAALMYGNAVVPGANKLRAMFDATGDAVMGRGTSFGDNYGKHLNFWNALEHRIESDKMNVPEQFARGAGWMTGGFGMSKALPEAALASAEYVPAAAQFLKSVTGSIRPGAGYGALQGGLDSKSDTASGTLADTALGLIGGGVLAPVIPLSVASASRASDGLGALWRYATGRGAESQAALNAQREAWKNAGVREFAPAMVDNPVMKATGQGGAGSLVGGPLQRGAQGSIDDTVGQVRRLINSGTGGNPINDVGEELQTDLRRALLERTRTVKGLPDAELERITGPVGDNGFIPPRPKVEPVTPREPPPIRARAVDPAEVEIPPVQPREITPPTRSNNYTPFEKVPYAPEHARAMAEAEAQAKQLQDEMASLKAAFDKRSKDLNRDPASVFSDIDKMAQQGDKRHMLYDDYERITRTYEDLQAAKQRLSEIKTAADSDRDAAWTAILLREDKLHGDEFKRAQAKHEADVAAARREAEEETRRLRTLELQRLQKQAEEEAAVKRAAAEDQVRREAMDATKRLEDDALTAWEREMAQRPGFRAGRSRESYPTEFDAAYERVTRETPPVQRNILGGEGASGSPYKTATEQLMDQFGIEGRRQGLVPGYKEGNPFGEAGGWAYNIGPYIDELVGSDIGRRLDAYANLRANKGFAPKVDGIRDFRTAVREEAQKAERPPFPATPRKREAAALRRIEGAVTEDMYRFLNEAGDKGQRAALMFQNVDREYANYINELRKPLAKLYGDNVKPIEAMDRVAKAAIDGDLKTLRAFMRVMEEKSDPLKASTAIIATLTNNAATLTDFVKGMQKLPRDSRAVIFRGQDGQYIMRQLTELERIATRLEPYEKAISGGVRIAGRGPDLTNPANIALGVAAISNFYTTLFMAAGSAGVARFMASPKFMTWLTRGARVSNQAQWNKHVQQLVRFADTDKEKLGGNLVQGIMQAVDTKANAMSGSGNGPDAHPFQPLFDAAKTKGVDHTKASPQEVIDAAWEASPTDQMGEMIDEIAKQMNLTPPWERKK